MVSCGSLTPLQLIPAPADFDNAAQTLAVGKERQRAATLPGTRLIVKPYGRAGNVDFALMLLEEMNAVLSGCTLPHRVEPGWEDISR